MNSNPILYFFLFIVLFFACRPEKHKKQKGFSHHPLGYYYQLLAFDTNAFVYKANYMARVSASFKTQADSVFWDSSNNFNDCFFIRIDSLQHSNFLQHGISRSAQSDSVCLLIPTAEFFKQQFNLKEVPFFSKTDSVVKINFRLQQILSPEKYADFNENLRRKEQEKIGEYVKHHQAEKDESGFYWLQKPAGLSSIGIKTGTLVKLNYTGFYLNNRFLEKAENFEFVYGTPDQLLKGLNYVIPKIKKGEVAKIILPSQLAFGENGSSNGAVPPFTPLLYEIKIIDIKE